MASNAQFRDFTALEFQDRMNVGSLIGWNPNQIFYVDSNTGSSSYNGTTRAKPKATLAQALALCADSKGDAVILLPGHAETLSTSSVTWSTAGVAVVGFGSARNRPALTCGAANVSGLIITGANNVLRNVRFIGSTSQTGAAVGCLDIQATDNIIENCVFEHGGAGPLQAVSLVSAHRTIFRGCYWLGTSAGPDMGVKTTAAVCNDVQFRDCIFNYGSVNVDSAAIGGLASGGYPGLIAKDLIILGANSSAIRNLGSYAATVPDGVIANVYGCSNTGITIGAAMPFDCGGSALANCFWTDAVAAASAWLGAALPPVAGSTANKAYVLSPGPT